MRSNEFGTVAEQLRRSTVQVHSGQRSCGSGTIWTSDGTVITNSHVVQGPSPTVTFWDGRSTAAEVVARDIRRDLLRLRVPLSGLPAVRVRDSSTLRAGEWLMAVGSPFGFVGALSTGVVHSSNTNWIQADVRLAPGNSGGPLADASGAVAGINSMLVGHLALAIPSNAVSRFMKGQSAPRLGVMVSTAPDQGLLLLEIKAGSPAERASLLPGDVLLINASALEAAMESGQAFTLRFRRGGSNAIREVTIAAEVTRAA